jgi:D-lactate dehydrogenase
MKVFVYNMREYDELPLFEGFCKELGMELGYTFEDPSADNYRLAEGSDFISIITTTIDSDLIDKFKSVGVRMIGTRTIGYDHIDIAHAKDAGMVVTNISYDPSGVAEYTVMLMLMAVRHMKRIEKHNAANNFALKGLLGKTVGGLKVGIIGAGQIGNSVLEDLSGFGCELFYYNRRRSEKADRYAKLLPLEELLSTCDIVSLHLELNKETHHFMDAEKIGMMGPGSFLINTARGPLVDTDALIEALEQKRIGGAALDVIEGEFGLYYNDCSEMEIDNPWMDKLRSMDDVILIHHLGFYYETAVRDMVYNCLVGMKAMHEGKDIPHRLARSELVLRGCQGLGPAGLLLFSVVHIPGYVAKAPSVGVRRGDPAYRLGIVARAPFHAGHAQRLVHEVGRLVEEPLGLPQLLGPVHIGPSGRSHTLKAWKRPGCPRIRIPCIPCGAPRIPRRGCGS